MRISKRSPRRSDAFRSRFLDAGRDAAPIRHVRRLREDLAGQIVYSLLQIAFVVALVLFARSVVHLFARHGSHLSPWYLRLSLAAILVCSVLVLWRLVRRIREIRDLRRELAAADKTLQELRAETLRKPRD